MTRNVRTAEASFGVKISRLDRIVLLAVIGFFFLFALGASGLLNDNEGSYADIAREMLTTGAYVVPHLNGVPYLEKPPLLPWLIAALFEVFGPSALVARAVPVTAGILLMAATYAFTARLKDELTAWVTVLILTSSLMFVVVLRTVMPDGLLICLFSIAMYLFYLWHSGGRRLFLVLSYAALGLAVLAKGFVALALGGLTILGFGAFSARSWRYTDLLDPRALLGLVAVTAPWHVFLVLNNFDFAWFYIYHEHVLRFLGLRRPRDYYTGPIYYYLPRIVVGLFPWSTFLPLLFTKRRPTTPSTGDMDPFLWVWFWVALAFFSLSEAKANYYMLIGMPPLAILLAERLVDRAREQRWRPILGLMGLVLAAGVFSVWIGISNVWVHYPRGLWIAAFKLRDKLIWSAAAFTAIAIVAAILLAMRRLRGALLALALTGVPVMLFASLVMQRAEPYVSERTLVDYLRAQNPDATVLIFRDFERLSSLPFYLRHNVPIVESESDDLRFGAQYGAPGMFLSREQFSELCRHRRVVLLVHRLRMDEFRATLGELGLRADRKIGNITLFEN